MKNGLAGAPNNRRVLVSPFVTKIATAATAIILVSSHATAQNHAEQIQAQLQQQEL